MCWEALQEEHRLQKYQTLQRRVGIQRDLITKNDQLLSELRKRDEEVRLEVSTNTRQKLLLRIMDCCNYCLSFVVLYSKKNNRKFNPEKQHRKSLQNLYGHTSKEVGYNYYYMYTHQAVITLF